MQFPNQYATVITIPTGATTGARIVLDGTTGLISVYNSSNQLVDIIGGSNGAIVSQNPSIGTLTFTEIIAGTILYGNLVNGVPDTVDAGEIAVQSDSSLIMTGSNPSNTTFTDAPLMHWIAGQPSQPLGSTTGPTITVKDTFSTSFIQILIAGALVHATVAGVLETWQTPTPGTGWANGPNSGTMQVIQFRKDVMDNLVIVGAMHSTSATPAVTMFLLPSAFRPAITQRVNGTSNAAGVATDRYFEINSNGVVSVNPNLTASGTDVYFEVIVPLGHIL
jgi:hypothetical protein